MHLLYQLVNSLSHFLLAYAIGFSVLPGYYVIILPRGHILKHRNQLSTEGRGHTCLGREIPTNAVFVPETNCIFLSQLL